MLSEALQNSLIDMLLDHIFNKDMRKRSVTEIEDIADEICTFFNNESKAAYFIPSNVESSPSGRLFNRYNTRIKQLRKQGLLPASSKEKNKKRKIEIEEEQEAEDADDTLQENIQLIKSYDRTQNIGIEDIIGLWNETFEYRKKKFRRETKHEILKDWPILQHPGAHRLILIDFEKNFGSITSNRHRTLIEGWNPFFTKSKIIFENLKNGDCLEMLKRIKRDFLTDQAENEKNVILSLALHGVFMPTLTSFGNGEVQKPSIIDSQDGFILLTTIPNFENAIRERKQVFKHPFIVGICTLRNGIDVFTKKKKQYKFIYDIRDIQQIQMFKVVFGTIHFVETNNFLKAVDFCFKMYTSLNIPYPECNKTWCFIDQAFYGITNNTTSRIATLLNKLK